MEWKSNLRIDGAAMSIYNIIAVAMVGIMTGVFNWMLARAGYLAPFTAGSVAEASAKLAENGWAAQVAGEKTIYVMGSGPAYGSAYIFSICNIEEMLQIDSPTINCCEFFHGPFRLARMSRDRHGVVHFDGFLLFRLLLDIAVSGYLKHADLAVTQNVFPLFTALSESCPVCIQDDLIFLFDDSVFFAVIFDQLLNGFLPPGKLFPQHGELTQYHVKHGFRYHFLLHTAHRLSAIYIRQAAYEILLGSAGKSLFFNIFPQKTVPGFPGLKAFFGAMDSPSMSQRNCCFVNSFNSFSFRGHWNRSSSRRL